MYKWFTLMSCHRGFLIICDVQTERTLGFKDSSLVTQASTANRKGYLD